MSRSETPASRSPSPPDDDSAGIKRAYRRVLIIWVAVLASLWWLQHAFI